MRGSVNGVPRSRKILALQQSELAGPASDIRGLRKPPSPTPRLGPGEHPGPHRSNPSLPLGPTAPLLLDGSEKARLAFTVCDLGLVFCPSPGTSAPRRAPHLAARKCPAPLRADMAVA